MAQNGTPRVRALLVDDLADDTAVLGKLLEQLGCEVCTCNSGQACLGLAASFQPHLVLLDVGMPKMSGLDVAKQLRAMELPPFLLVARTGFTDEATKAKCVEAGFNHVLVKPDDPSRLCQLLDLSRQLVTG